MPEQWKRSIIHPLHKKGNILECSNYRGISLLQCAYKVLSNIIYRKLLPFAEREIGKYQAGFRGGRSTTDQMFGLRMILEKSQEYRMITHHLCDFQSANDSIKRRKLYVALVDLGIPL